MWCTIWCPGNNTETPSRSEAVSSLLGAHDSQKTYPEAMSIHFLTQKEPWVTRPGHLGFHEVVFCCFAESLDLKHLPKSHRLKYSF